MAPTLAVLGCASGLSAQAPPALAEFQVNATTTNKQIAPSASSLLAKFLDVPTSHRFFQFVEAFAAAGITGGCGSGNFWPNNPVTRGQMATLPAKALGLQFQ